VPQLSYRSILHPELIHCKTSSPNNNNNIVLYCIVPRWLQYHPSEAS